MDDLMAQTQALILDDEDDANLQAKVAAAVDRADEIRRLMYQPENCFTSHPVEGLKYIMSTGDWKAMYLPTRYQHCGRFSRLLP